MGFKSAANVADKSKIESDELKNYFNGLNDTTRADKEQMNQMASKTRPWLNCASS